ncbi:integrase catalytic domain-containing protein [Trichonephila clavipes]|nr:integrase catalytic domain-containing protein [Trichonephila clavipes]
MIFFYSKDNLVALHFKYDQARRRFVEWAQNEIAVVPDFHKRILFSDEAHFWLNGYVNKQNCRIWSEANPQVYVETPLHPEKLTVWCALWAGGIIGPYFFKNDEGHNELWFQQDGATCHTARATIDLLKDTFGDRLISRFGPVNWPPRSCDLTPLDYFLWGYVKSLVYADKPQTLDHLEDNIRRVIADIRPQMLEKVIENSTSRLDYFRASRGSHMPEIIFKMDKIPNEPVMQLVLPRCKKKPNMSGEIAEFVQTCKVCQLRKPEKIGDVAPITPIVRPELLFKNCKHRCDRTYSTAIWHKLQIGFNSIIYEKDWNSSPRFSCPGYPVSNGLVERWKKALKDMIHHVIREDPRSWDRQLPFLLFAYREVPNTTTGVSPFRLLYGREARGPLAILKANVHIFKNYLNPTHGVVCNSDDVKAVMFVKR